MKVNKENFPLKVVAAVTYLIMVTMNALANIIPINGMNTGEISDSFPNLFAPAPITFTVWGVIYFLLLLYVIYQFGIFQKDSDPNKEELFKKIGIYFSISSVANAIWILAWHYKLIPLSLILIVVVLICMIIINQHTKASKLSLKDNFFIRLPFSIYFGWVTVATIANVTTLLVDIGWNGFGISETIWMILILIVGALITIATILRNKNFFYGLVVIWAYIGIYIKHTSSSGFNGEYQSIITTTTVCLVFFLLTEIYMIYSQRKV